MSRSAVRFGQMRELCRQMAHRHIIWHVPSIRRCDRFPAGFRSAQLPANFFVPLFVIRFSTRYGCVRINLQARPSMVPLDFQALHAEPLKNHHGLPQF